MESKPTLRPDLREVVKDILALRNFAKLDGYFKTHKSQRALLEKLNAQDLATVTRAIADAEAANVAQ